MRPINREALTPPAPLNTPRLRLEPLGPQHFGEMWAALNTPDEADRLTGTHTKFTPQAVRAHLEAVSARDDRADRAIVRALHGSRLGEVVFSEPDPDNRVMNFRILLAHTRDQGYGSEATRAVTASGLEVVGLHRIHLGVYTSNPRARRVYEKCGFVAEGLERDALYWEGEWVDLLCMSLLDSDPRPQGVSRRRRPGCPDAGPRGRRSSA